MKNAEDVKNRIGKVTGKYAGDFPVNIYSKGIEIVDSYKISGLQDRLEISRIIHDAHLTHRTPENLAAEWRVHNVAYKLHVGRHHAKDVMLDYSGDVRKSVRVATKLFELLKLY